MLWALRIKRDFLGVVWRFIINFAIDFHGRRVQTAASLPESIVNQYYKLLTNNG